MRWCLPWLLLGVACKSPAPAPAEAPPPAPPLAPTLQLSSLGIQDVTPADRRPVALSEDQIRAALAGALAEAGLKRGKDKTRWRVAVDARVVYGIALDDGIAKAVAAGPLKVSWEASLRMRPPGEPALNDFVQVTGGADFTGDAAALRGALEAQLKSTAAEVAAQVAAQTEAYAAPPALLIDRLKDERRSHRISAATRLGMLRHAPAVAPLVERLKQEPDPIVRLRIVGALTELADPAAADALIALADPKDRELLSGVVGALSAMGGQRANDFLDILSSHDAPDIREMVLRARARIERRKARDLK